MEKMKVGILGLGDICDIYIKNIQGMFSNLEIVGAYNRSPQKAARIQETYQLPKIYDSYKEMLEDPQVEIILNLTTPLQHFETTKAALMAGKHVYTEKPLASTFSEARELFDLAQSKGLSLCGAPDTFLGSGILTCKKLIEDGFIGSPVGASAHFLSHGHEHWHPNPAFFYQYGGGPMLDIGPYYLTALVTLLGPAKRVSGMAKTTFLERKVLTAENYGNPIQVEVPTYVNGLIQFENGAVGDFLATFDVYVPRAKGPFIEIYGSQGSLIVPDPNNFSGEILFLKGRSEEYEPMPQLFDYQENSRGLGLSDMAQAIQENRPAKASGKMMLHVAEIMESILESGKIGREIELETQL